MVISVTEGYESRLVCAGLLYDHTSNLIPSRNMGRDNNCPIVSQLNAINPSWLSGILKNSTQKRNKP